MCPADKGSAPAPPSGALALQPPFNCLGPSSDSEGVPRCYYSQSGACLGNWAQCGSPHRGSPGPAELGRHPEHACFSKRLGDDPFVDAREEGRKDERKKALKQASKQANKQASKETSERGRKEEMKGMNE